MRHSFLDKYAYQDTPVHRLDGRVKLIVFGVLIVAAATTPARAWWALVGYGLVLCCLIAGARIPPLYVLTRWLVVLPFILVAAASAPFLKGGEAVWTGTLLGMKLTATEHGLSVAVNTIARASVSVVALITLLSVTPMADLLESLRRLKAPAVLVMLAGFAYRYVFVLAGEAHRLKTARESRSFGRGALMHMRGLGKTIASLFVRSCERAERVYAAMLSRGYDANRPPASAASRLCAGDVGFLAVGLFAVILLRISVLWTCQTS